MNAPDKQVVVSFHDLHPGTRAQGQAFLDMLRRQGVARASLLVVPRFHGAPFFANDKGFTRWLERCVEQGHELCLHGFYHKAGWMEASGFRGLLANRFYTAREDEFFQIMERDAESRLRQGIGVFRRAHLPVSGFTAPAWLMNASARQALAHSGLRYCTAFRGILRLPDFTPIPAPVLTCSSRSAWRRAASRWWVPLWARIRRRSPILRLAVHPTDLAHPDMAALVERTLAALLTERRPRTYLEIVDERC